MRSVVCIAQGWAGPMAAVVLGLVVGAALAQGTVPAPLVQRSGDQVQIGSGWRLLTLPQQKPPVTDYSAVLLDGRPALRIEARAAYGNLGHALSGPAPATLRWAWRLDQANPALRLDHKAGDDSPAKVCLSFDLPLSRVPFFERELLRLARLRSPEPLPAATLCWVWGHAEPSGAVLPNPYTRRVRYIVLRGQADATGRWVEESRDVGADFRAAFGDESPTVPPVTAVLVSGDADNTGAQSLAHVAGLELIPAAGK
jgi:Protein of unknown function (DUF3047)